MHVTAIIAAGGRGQRFGGSQPKQLQPLGGRTILDRSVALFTDHAGVDEVIVALPADILADPPGYLRSDSKPVRLVAGGDRRQDSVANAFAAASERSELIVIHDAARPFASADLITRTIAAAVHSGAALAAMPARDTVKRATMFEGPAKAGHYVRHVAETLPRESIFLAQTPQAFRREVLKSALALGGRAGAGATDEAELAERAGHRVTLVEGEASNIKITTPEDFAIAEAIARGRTAVPGRAGIGYDVHRLVEGRPLILGGVTIPFDRGLAGHSDADAVCHAVTEAILGAAAAGDIGRHFPDTDAKWKGASSIDLLRRAARVVRDCGLEITNVDASVVAERPKLAPYVDAMRANVAAALGIEIANVSIKGKTNEGLGDIGRGEAIAVHAVAFLHAR
jgi:2-C-methyl-D-erythritol 4-phosphate cytidylyltransferase / 2-C-methyl-D-erythritol 2,4-cyclodiphosphate synthase